MTHSNVRFMCVALYVWCRRPKTGRASLFFFFCYNYSAAGVATSQLAFSSDQDISFGFGETLFSCLLWVWGWWPLSLILMASLNVWHITRQLPLLTVFVVGSLVLPLLLFCLGGCTVDGAYLFVVLVLHELACNVFKAKCKICFMLFICIAFELISKALVY